jgi:putative oxidoreductase
MSVAAARLNTARPIAPLVLRVGIGVVFTYHGWQKLDGGISNFGLFLESLGLPAPDVLAYLVTGLELIGGAMLILGLLTRLPAILLAVQMALIAFWIKPTKMDLGLIAPPDAPGTGSELDLALMVGCIAIAVLGPGALALDRLIGAENKATIVLPAGREEAAPRESSRV